MADPESGWSKEETDYLFDLVGTYSARFYIILDRYEYAGKL
jgi:SANT/Myb-like domain of DAMP1